MENIELLIKIEKITIMSNLIERMSHSMRDISNCITKLQVYKQQYIKHCELFEKNIKLNETDEMIDDKKIENIKKNIHTYKLSKLEKDLSRIEEKYNNLSEYYYLIDIGYYKETLQSIIDELF